MCLGQAGEAIKNKHRQEDLQYSRIVSLSYADFLPLVPRSTIMGPDPPNSSLRILKGTNCTICWIRERHMSATKYFSHTKRQNTSGFVR